METTNNTAGYLDTRYNDCLQDLIELADNFTETAPLSEYIDLLAGTLFAPWEYQSSPIISQMVKVFVRLHELGSDFKKIDLMRELERLRENH